MKHFTVLLCVLVASTLFSARAASADSCPVRFAYAGLVGLGAQHGTAEYELLFASGARGVSGPFDLAITANLSDGTQVHFDAGDVSTRPFEFASHKIKNTVTLFPFAMEVRSFRIDSARDSHGVSTCADDSPYSPDDAFGSQSIHFEDSATSLWPVKSPGAVDITDASFDHRVPPNYPPFAMMQGAQGEVAVYVVILPDGSIGSASIGESSGYDQLDSAALEAARKTTYKPAHLSEALGGKAITSAYFIVYMFSMG
jgi:TonB family protein